MTLSVYNIFCMAVFDENVDIYTQIHDFIMKHENFDIASTTICVNHDILVRTGKSSLFSLNQA